jgi:hypothetical protein
VAAASAAASAGAGAAAAKPQILTVGEAKRRLNELLDAARTPRKAGKAGSVGRSKVHGSVIPSVQGSFMTQCPGVRGDINFQKSSNTLSWIYKGHKEGQLYCYLCSLAIIGENAHFEHVLAFLSALAKGLIPVRGYDINSSDFDKCLMFVQGCLGEWAHQHCNSTCKGELDFTNNRTRPHRNNDWSDLVPNEETITKVLRCIWNQTTAGTSDLRPDLQKIYGSEVNFIAQQRPKIVYRVQMCIEMIKCFVDFGRYRKTKVFLKNAGLAYANAKLTNARYPIGPIIQSHFDRADRHPIVWQRVLPFLGINANQVNDSISFSGKMYLETTNLAHREQTLVAYPNRNPSDGTETNVHPTDNKTQTFGGNLLSMFNCNGGGGGAGAGAALYPGGAAAGYGKNKRKGMAGFTEGGASSASTRRQRRQQRRQKKLLTQKRQKPQVTVEIVPYQP